MVALRFCFSLFAIGVAEPVCEAQSALQTQSKHQLSGETTAVGQTEDAFIGNLANHFHQGVDVVRKGVRVSFILSPLIKLSDCLQESGEIHAARTVVTLAKSLKAHVTLSHGEVFELFLEITKVLANMMTVVNTGKTLTDSGDVWIVEAGGAEFGDELTRSAYILRETDGSALQLSQKNKVRRRKNRNMKNKKGEEDEEDEEDEDENNKKLDAFFQCTKDNGVFRYWRGKIDGLGDGVHILGLGNGSPDQDWTLDGTISEFYHPGEKANIRLDLKKADMSLAQQEKAGYRMYGSMRELTGHQNMYAVSTTMSVQPRTFYQFR